MDGKKDKSWQIAPQTKLYFVGYILLFISMLLTIIYKKLFSTVSYSVVFINLVVFVISLYVINCTVIGHCNLYAWIVAYVFIVFGLFTSIITLFNLYKNN